MEIDGPAQLMAAGNSSPQHNGSFTDETFRLYRGRGLIIVRSLGDPGEIFVRVSGEGLPVASTRNLAR